MTASRLLRTSILTFAGLACATLSLACKGDSTPAAEPSSAKPTESEAKAPEKPLVEFSAAVFKGPEGPQLVAHFDLQPGWHIYWENPGDSGLPTKVTSKATKLGPLRFPLPKIMRDPAGAVSYGYEGEVDLFAELPEAQTIAGQKLEFQASWLVCDSEGCIRGKGTAEAEVPQNPPTLPATLASTLAEVPKPAGAQVEAEAEFDRPAKRATLRFTLPEGAVLHNMFPLVSEPAVYAGHEVENGTLEVKFQEVPAGDGSSWAQRVAVVALELSDKSTTALELGLPGKS